MILLFVSFLAMAEVDHGLPGQGGRPSNKGSIETACPISISDLAQAANGESVIGSQIATYLTTPSCIDKSSHYASEVMGIVRLRDKGPYGFIKKTAQRLGESKFESLSQIEKIALGELSVAVRESPLSASDFAVIGQLAILSPKLGIKGLGNAIQNELVRDSSSPEDLAAKLVRFGASLDPIALEVANGVEEMTVLGEGNSLSPLLKNLSAAATREPTLIPTFNKSALAVKRGVTRGLNVFDKKNRLSLSSAIFWGISGAVLGAAELEAEPLDEALALLTKKKSRLSKAMLPRAVLILSRSDKPKGLARSVASSIGTDSLSWKGEDRLNLFTASRQFYDLALAIQNRFIALWAESWKMAERGDLSSFNLLKKNTLEPTAREILELSPDLVSPEFVSFTIRGSLVSDKIIESRLPKLVLDRLEHERELSQVLFMEKNSAAVGGAVASKLGNALALQLTYIPALNGWIERQSKDP